MKPVPLFALAGALLLLTACEDPSNVGLGLVGEGGGEPVVQRVDVSPFEAVAAARDVTGNRQRLLAGRVADPLLGTISATGYFDFTALDGDDVGGFRDTTLVSATLQLTPDYVYGDTTSPVTFTLRSVPEELDAADAPADTTLPEGDVITSFSFVPTDSLVSVPLPASWIAENDTTLRSEQVTSVFHGFELAPASGTDGAVVGFNQAGSRLQAVAGADTVSFGAAGNNTGVKSITNLARAGEPALPADRVLLQDGLGPRVRLSLDLSEADLLGEALNRVALHLYPDTLALDGSSGFYRPRPPALALYGVLEDGTEAEVATAVLDEAGRYAFSSNDLRAILQGALLGEETFDHYEIVVPSVVNTISPVLFYGPGSGETAPQMQLVVTEIDR